MLHLLLGLCTRITVRHRLNVLSHVCTLISFAYFFSRQWVTVGGIRSTGVSGSLGLSDKVRRLVTEDLNLEPSRGGSSSLTKPDWHFSQRGTTVIEGKDVVITHPLTFYGNKMVVAKI